MLPKTIARRSSPAFAKKADHSIQEHQPQNRPVSEEILSERRRKKPVYKNRPHRGGRSR